LSNTIGSSTDPKITVSGSNVYVAWNEGATPTYLGQAFIAASTNEGANFQTPKSIAQNITAFNPQISASANNVYAAMIYINPTFGTPDIVAAKSTDNGATFGVIENVSNNRGLSFNPQISVSDKGYVYVLWEDNSAGNFDILFRSTNTAVWSDPLSLGGFVTYDPTTAENQDGRLQAFVVNGIHQLSTRWQIYPNGIWSNDWSSLGGYLSGNIAVGHNMDGRLQVFAKGFLNWSNSSQLYNGLISITQSNPSSNNWNNWISLGGYLTGDPVVAANADGRLQVFAKGANNDLVTISQVSANSNIWTGWTSLGGYLTGDPVVAANADGRLQVFAKGIDNSIVTIYQDSPNSNKWIKDLIPLTLTGTPLNGYMISQPAIGKNLDGRLLVAVTGKDNEILYTIQAAPNSKYWSSWQSLGGYSSGKPTIISNADGRIEVFAKGGYFDIWHKWQTQILPNGEIRWSPDWKSLSYFYTSNIAASKNQDGHLEVFAKDGHNGLWSIFQLGPNVDQ